MARVDLPQSRLRSRKRQRRIRIVLLIAAVLLVAVGGLVALLRAPFVRVTVVTVSGTQALNADDIQNFVQSRIAGNYLFVFPRNDIFLYPQKELAAELLAKYPVAKSIDVHADNFHTIAVVVAERQPAALWCPSTNSGQATDCYAMDEDGVIYAPAASSSAQVTYGGATSGEKLPKQYLTTEQFHALTALVAALTQTESSDPVRQVAVDDSGDVRVYFQNNFLLMFSLHDAGGDIFERFTLALKSDPLAGKSLGDIEYLDLRFGDKLYYKLKGK